MSLLCCSEYTTESRFYCVTNLVTMESILFFVLHNPLILLCNKIYYTMESWFHCTKLHNEIMISFWLKKHLIVCECIEWREGIEERGSINEERKRLDGLRKNFKRPFPSHWLLNNVIICCGYLNRRIKQPNSLFNIFNGINLII